MTVIATIDDALVTDALVAWLQQWQQLVDMEATIEDAEPVNESPEHCPWVGVYHSRTDLVARTLGLGAGYRMQRISLALALTAASADSGHDCKVRLGALIQAVCSALCSNESISGTVVTLEDIGVVRSNYAQVGGQFFQEAVVTVTAVVPVTAS